MVKIAWAILAAAGGAAPRHRRAAGARRRASCRRARPRGTHAASVGPPSSRSDWTPSAASSRELFVERPRPQLELRALGQRPAAEGEPARLAARRRRRRAHRAAARRRAPFPSRPRRRPRRRGARARAGGSPRRRPSAARHGDAAVERRRDLVGDERPALRDPRSATPRSGRAPPTHRASSTSMPAARSVSIPPAASGFGSRAPTTTRAMPSATIRSAQGGVVPWCAQGSSVTNIVAPRAAVPAASSATTSACRPPCLGHALGDDVAVTHDDGADRRLRIGAPGRFGGEREGAGEAHAGRAARPHGGSAGSASTLQILAAGRSRRRS